MKPTAKRSNSLEKVFPTANFFKEQPNDQTKNDNNAE